MTAGDLSQPGGQDRRGHRKLNSYDLPDWVRHPQKEDKLKAALLFPGEQNHAVGMLQDVRRRPGIRALLEAATRVYGFDVEELMLEGPASDMVHPSVNLPLMYVADCAAFEVLREANEELASRCQAVAGVGVGEYAALYAAGVITYEQGLGLVKARAGAVQELADELRAEAISIRGLPVEAIERYLKAVLKAGGGGSDAQVYIAGHWSPEGVVCAGRHGPVAMLQEMVARDGGAANGVDVRPLGNVAANTPLARAACEKIAAAVDKLIPAMKPPRCDLFLNRTGLRVPAGKNPQAFAEALKTQLTSPVQWESSVTQMLVWGIREFYECGPNRSLRFNMRFFEHLIEAPLEVVRPAEFTHSVSV